MKSTVGSSGAPILDLDSAVTEARRILDAVPRHHEGPIVLAFHGDADGLCATRCLLEALAPSHHDLRPIFPDKGEHAHTPGFLARVGQCKPSLMVVLDMGSRPEPLLPGVPTLIIDHHRPTGFPPEAHIVSSFGRSPTEPAALLAYLVGSALHPLGHLDWVATVGTVADLGSGVPFAIVQDALNKYGRQTIRATGALLNAAKRSTTYDVATALDALCQSHTPNDIVDGTSVAARRLHEYRAQVNAEVARWSRTAPIISNGIALIVIRSAAQVHPLLAVRWTRRLDPNVVVVANVGYRPDWVHFAVRSAQPRNLPEFLSALRNVIRQGDVGYGHDRASGGVVPIEEFTTILAHWGFPQAVIGHTLALHADRQ